MRRWLLVIKEKDYELVNVLDWEDIRDEDEIECIIDHNIHKGDKVIIYRSGQWTQFSHIFEVKDCFYLAKNEYLLQLHQKKEIPEGIELSELKKVGIIKKHRKFRRKIYKVPLCCWSEIVGFIKEKHPEIFLPPNENIFEGPDERGYPDILKNELINTIQNIRKLDKCPPNEEATKYRIILPLLKAMGFNIYDPEIVKPEYSISERFVDYTLTDHNSNKILLEAKQPSVDLDGDPHKQLRWFCASQNINQGILTNGIKWRFYTFYFYESELGAIEDIEYNEVDILKDKKDLIFNVFLSFLWNNKSSDYTPKKYTKNLSHVVKQMKISNQLNESEVKQILVMPLLESLGWDTSDEKEFVFNPNANVKIKKNKKWVKRNIRPDYALKREKKICVEVKATGIKDLEDHAGIVKAFCEKKKFDIGVATDGLKWDFIIFKDHKYYDEKEIDIEIDSEEKCIKYFQRYLSPKYASEK